MTAVDRLESLDEQPLAWPDAGPREPGPVLTGLVLLLVVVLGTPRVWADLGSGTLGLESVFFPVIGIAFACLAVSRRRGR